MKPFPVRFCVGCGYLCDEPQPESGNAQWIDAHRFLMKYGYHWDDLDRTDDACPGCARLFAIAGRGVLPAVHGTVPAT